MKKVFTTFLMVLIGFSTYAQWNQLGADIDGEAAGDRSGFAVSTSSDGLTVAIGAISNNGSVSQSGHVRVYKLISGSWTQQGADIDGEAYQDLSGVSVSLSGDGAIVAIGARNNNGGGTNSGHVRVFKLIGGAWIQQGADIDGEAAQDLSGLSTSLSTDGLTVAIGALNNDGTGINAGHVRVYKFIASAWVQQGLDIDGEAAGDQSGYSVSLSADGLTLASGGRLNDGTGADAGHVRVYKFISGVWTQQGGDIDGEAAIDQFGSAVSLSADGLTLAAGARGNDGGGSNSGHVRVFKLISGAWIQQGLDIDGEAADNFTGAAGSVSLSANGLTVAIGASGNDDAGIDAGQVRVYRFISGVWVQHGTDIDGEAADDLFGFSVSLSHNGLNLAAGAKDNAGTGFDAGHVRVYNTCWPSIGIDVQTACESYTWIDGNTYTSSTNTPIDTLFGAAANGCDSLVTLDLTITPLPDNTITTTGLTITANQIGATYQWIDCNNGNSSITGETNASYTATANGDYAVIVTDNGCSDTSACVNISTVGVGENFTDSQVSISPNPTKGNVEFQLGNLKDVSIEVFSLTGKLVYQAENINTTAHQLVLNNAPGFYIVNVVAEGKSKQFKLIKE